MATFEPACEICPFALPEDPACYPTGGQLAMLGEKVLAEIAPCAFRRLGEERFDALTGLYSYRTFHEKLWQAFRHERAADFRTVATPEGEHRVRPGGFVFIDGERVHELNQEIGHATVDTGLKAVADVLRGSLRDGDLFCRRSGDEFVAFLPGAEQVVTTVTERLDRALASGVPMKGGVNLQARLHMIYADDISSYQKALEMIDEADKSLGSKKRQRAETENPEQPSSSFAQLLGRFVIRRRRSRD